MLGLYLIQLLCLFSPCNIPTLTFIDTMLNSWKTGGLHLQPSVSSYLYPRPLPLLIILGKTDRFRPNFNRNQNTPSRNHPFVEPRILSSVVEPNATKLLPNSNRIRLWDEKGFEHLMFKYYGNIHQTFTKYSLLSFSHVVLRIL